MEAPMVEIEHVSLWYGEKLALKDISMSIPKAPGDRVHRSVRLRQDDLLSA